MGQIENLKSNIEELTEVILSLNEKEKAFDISKYFMTPRQIAKKMMKVSATVATDAGENPIPLDERSIHIVVYGKYMIGADGKVVDNEIKYPECVDKDRAMSLNHPTLKDKVPNMMKEVKKAIRSLNIKKSDLKDAFTFAIKQIATSLTVMAAAAIQLPIGSGLPTAFAALQSVVAAINQLVSSVMVILPILGPLVDIPLLIAEAVVEVVLGLVNTILMALLIVLNLIATLKKLIVPILMIPGVK